MISARCWCGADADHIHTDGITPRDLLRSIRAVYADLRRLWGAIKP